MSIASYFYVSKVVKKLLKIKNRFLTTAALRETKDEADVVKNRQGRQNFLQNL